MHVTSLGRVRSVPACRAGRWLPWLTIRGTGGSSAVGSWTSHPVWAIWSGCGGRRASEPGLRRLGAVADERSGTARCADCRAETRPLAVSLFERSKLPLDIWFAAAWHLTDQNGGVSALSLQRALGLGSYRTARTLTHKLRRAMIAPERAPARAARGGRRDLSRHPHTRRQTRPRRHQDAGHGRRRADRQLQAAACPAGTARTRRRHRSARLRTAQHRARRHHPHRRRQHLSGPRLARLSATTTHTSQCRPSIVSRPC